MNLIRSLSLLALAALTGAASAQEVYMSGLASPRGMFFDTDGTLYVAEAGTGGGTFGVPFTGGGGSGTFGLSGGIASRKGTDAQRQALYGLPSIADATGEGEPIGAADIARTADGRFAVLFGLGAGVQARNTLGAAGAMMGTLSYFDPTTHSWSLGQDYAALEQGLNPDGGEINANPFGMASDGKGGFVVADGGANAIWRPGAGAVAIPGQMVPNPFGPGTIPQEAVPTSVVARPGGGYLVGELGGFPFSPGKSRIHSIGADGSYLGSQSYGLTGIVDMAYASDGSLLVVEIADQGLLAGGPGAVKRIRQDGKVDTLISGLTTPTSVAFHDGQVYVTNDALSGNGQVLRYAYAPVPEPASMIALGVGALGLLRRRKRS